MTYVLVWFVLRIWRDRMEHAIRVFIDAVTRARNSSCEQRVASRRNADDLRATAPLAPLRMAVTDFMRFLSVSFWSGDKVWGSTNRDVRRNGACSNDGYRDGRISVTRGENTTSLISIPHQHRYIPLPHHIIEGLKENQREKKTK